MLLVHGLAANGEVWNGGSSLADQHWPGCWIAPDLLGHGRSSTASSYSYAEYAADLAGLVDADHPVTVLGHSMGGVIGLTLARGSFGVSVERVIGVGIKVVWTEDEAAKMRAQAARPPAVFADREEAVARSLRLSGLSGLVDLNSAVAAAGVVEGPDGFRLGFDPAVNGVGRPPMRDLLAAAQATVALACGAADPMVSVDQLRLLDKDLLDEDLLDIDTVELPGVGHNAHVENPALLWQTLLAGRPRGRETSG